jgi:hypothetical protein
MSTTPHLQKLVREGRLSPYDAALLMNLRNRVRDNRERVRFREHPFLATALFFTFLVMSLLGIQREQA